MMVGSCPARSRIQPIMPVVVDLPLVPATPMRWAAALNSSASSSARVMMARSSRRADWTSGMLSSTAPDITRIWPRRFTPLPSWGCRATPRPRRKSNRAVLRPWSSARSEPSTTPPRAKTISARGVMPLPPTPQKKEAWPGIIAGPYERRPGGATGPSALGAKRMSREWLKIGVVATASRMAPEVAERVPALARSLYGEDAPEIVFHPEVLASAGHFAGDDATRARAFLDVANDPSFDALWFARGGYGACRIGEAVLAGLAPAAHAKTYLGYSDAGALLGGLYRAGFPHVAHGPVAQDIMRDGGDA